MLYKSNTKSMEESLNGHLHVEFCEFICNVMTVVRCDLTVNCCGLMFIISLQKEHAV